MGRIAVVAVCDFRKLPNGGEVFLLNNLFSAMQSDKNEYYLIGMTFNDQDRIGKWNLISIGGRTYNFFPVAKVTKDKEKTKIPFRLRMVYGLIKYKSTIMSMGFDSVYIHSAELGIPFWHDYNRINLIYHVHGDPSQTLRYSRFPLFRFEAFTKLYLALINKTIKKSKKIIWAANRPKNEYKKLASEEMVDIIEKKSVTVHSSFDRKLTVDYDSIPRLTNRRHLVTVSRLAKIKHVDFIIECLKELIVKGYNVDLIVCGDGEELEPLKKLAKNLGISDRVLFFGLCNRKQIATCLNCSDVFLFASESEAMSLVVLESLYMGTPVVSTDVGDISDVVVADKTGYIVEGYKLHDYVQMIEKVMRKNKAEYLNECRSMVQRYTPEFMAVSIDEEMNNVK